MKTKGIKYLFLFLVLILLVIPKPASAIIGTGLFDYFNAFLQGLDTAVGPIFTWEIITMIFHIISLVFLFFSTGLLDYILTESPAWLSVNHNDMVLAGWQFTSGLANLFIVLALIVLAFGFILKIESLEARKTLPRLIIVALLVNFSLVFIGALIDIANILYTTVYNAGGPGLIAKTIQPLQIAIFDIISKFFLTLYLRMMTTAVPLSAPFIFLAKAVTFIKIGFIPIAFNWLINAFLSFTLAGIFLVFAFIFAARVFIIQALAIVSPIIFLTWAFPPLKKYWDEWLSHLLEWLFFGVILYFFMVIGMKMSTYLMPSVTEVVLTGIPVLNTITILPILKYYFFLFVYLVVIIYFGRRLTPNIGSALVAYGTTWLGTATAATLPLLSGLRREARYAALEARRKEMERYKEAGADYENRGKEELTDEQKEIIRGGFWTKAGSALVGFEETVNKMQGTTLTEEGRKDTIKAKADADRISDFGLLKTRAELLERQGRTEEAAMYRMRMVERNPGYKGQGELQEIEEGEIKILEDAEEKGKITKEEYEEALEKYEKDGGIITKEIKALNAIGAVVPAGILARAVPSASWKALGEVPRKESAEYEKFVNNLSEEEQIKIAKKGGLSEELISDEDARKKFLIRATQLLYKTDPEEMGAWNKEFIEAAVPITSQVWNIEQELAATQLYRLPLRQEIQSYSDKKGLAKILLSLPTSKLNSYPSITAKIAGMPMPGKVDDETYNEWMTQRQNLDLNEPQLTHANNVVNELYGAGYKEVLDEYIKRNPERLGDLGLKGADIVKTDLDNFMKGQAGAKASPGKRRRVRSGQTALGDFGPPTPRSSTPSSEKGEGEEIISTSPTGAAKETKESQDFSQSAAYEGVRRTIDKNFKDIEESTKSGGTDSDIKARGNTLSALVRDYANVLGVDPKEVNRIISSLDKGNIESVKRGVNQFLDKNKPSKK